MQGTVGAARTLVLPLWGPNGVKNAALDATEALFTQVVRFYVHVLLVEPSPWARVPKLGNTAHVEHPGRFRLNAAVGWS